MTTSPWIAVDTTPGEAHAAHVGSAPNPSIWGESARKALVPGQDGAAPDDANPEHVSLDTAELRELERAELYGETPEIQVPARPRSLIDRLLRRST